MADTRRLPPPVTEAWDWQRAAACRGLDSAVFFLSPGARGRLKVEQETRAKQVCARCPVIEECRRHALSVEEPYGVWGGLDADERRSLHASRRRGVPS